MPTIARIDDPSALVPQIGAVYRSAFSGFADGPSEEEVRTFSSETLLRHSGREAFRFLAALDGEALVGFIYGYHGRPGEWWEDWLRRRIPPAAYGEWFVDQFDLTEFCVSAEWQGRGIGSRLYEALLAELRTLPYRRMVLTTRRRDNPARGFYARRGWQVVWDAVDERFALLGLPLPRQ